MSTIARVQSMYEAFGRGDIPFIIDQLADDVKWEDGGSDHGIPWLTPGVGKAHVASFFGEIANFEFHRFDVEGVMGDGNMVVGVVQVDVTVKTTGGHFAGLEIHLWRFGSDGKVTSFNHCVDTIDHLAAAPRAMQSV